MAAPQRQGQGEQGGQGRGQGAGLGHLKHEASPLGKNRCSPRGSAGAGSRPQGQGQRAGLGQFI